VSEADTTNNYVPISLEERFAESIPAKVGDSIVFNVQGMFVSTVVESIRQVDWNRIETNFRLVFPVSVLEDAPQIHVLLTRVPSKEASANYQEAVVKKFPNVSIIDLGLVLAVLDEVLNRIGYVIHFMAAFSVITGLIVLIASVRISKYQRMHESVLLRTLGASRKQIFTITLLEYFFLGALSGTYRHSHSSWRELAIGNLSIQISVHTQLASGWYIIFGDCSGNSWNRLVKQPRGVAKIAARNFAGGGRMSGCLNMALQILLR
jgi:predicted lysophospholipase L1 biosynthesis ABC-type transport system permease subunit